MMLVVDTSVLVAALVGEPDRGRLIAGTEGRDLLAPESVHWEIGNALSSLLKRKRVTMRQVELALSAYAHIPVRFMDVELSLALDLAFKHGLYAYDAYVIACALTQKVPLLTLDKGLTRAAIAAGVQVQELQS